MPNTVVHGKRKYKQMALEVAVRNPERYPDILRVLAKFEGRKLDNDCILEIYMQLYKDHAITAQHFDPDEHEDAVIKKYIRDNNTHNNEWGYPTGYPAAFTRYLKTLSELGFIYSQYQDELKISPVAKALLNGEIDASEAFALQCMRFWRKSPYRRVLNDFNYFSFILQVINKLNAKGKKLSYPQFVLSLFSDDGNVDKFINEIETIKCGNDQNKMYKYIVSHYSEVDDLHAPVNKMNTVFRDYGNTVFRVLQFTGLISVDATGPLLISINSSRSDFFDFLLRQNFSITPSAKNNELEYFNEIGCLPDKLKNNVISYRNLPDEPDNLNYNFTLAQLVQRYGLEETTICDMINQLAGGRSDRHFWFLSDPLKLEFYITLLLYIEYGNNFEIRPNYKADDNGIPYEHAPGNVGDIYVSNGSVNWLIEVTLIRSRDQQLNSETTNCVRHFENTLTNKDNYLSFVAPVLHEDTKRMYQTSLIDLAMKRNENIFMKSYDINSFLEVTIQKNNYEDMEDEKNSIMNNLHNLVN